MSDEDVKLYKASKSLQAKVGTGTVSKETIEKVTKNVEEKSADFEPMATKFLEQLTEAVNQAKDNEDEDMKVIYERVANPVMQLKANASMFGYPLIGDLANIMLSFLESLSEIDAAIIQIIEANQKTWQVIIAKQMKGDGGQYGEALRSELKGVCERYLKKKLKEQKIARAKTKQESSE